MRARQKSRDSRESRSVRFFSLPLLLPCAGSPQRWLHILSVNFRTAQFIWNVERTIVRWHKQFVNDGFDAVGVHRVKKAFRKTHLDVHVNGRHKVDSIAMRMTNANIYKMCRVFFHEPTMKPWDMRVVHKIDSGSFFFSFFLLIESMTRSWWSSTVLISSVQLRIQCFFSFSEWIKKERVAIHHCATIECVCVWSRSGHSVWLQMMEILIVNITFHYNPKCDVHRAV